MKFRVEIECTAIGHLEGAAEADSKDDAREALNSKNVLNNLYFVVDDYKVEGYYPDGETYVQQIYEGEEE